MAISAGLAMLGSAIIGGGASALASSKNSKAINQATQATTDATAQNTALQRETRDINNATLNQFVRPGVAASNAMSRMLGLGSFDQQPQQQFGQQFNPQQFEQGDWGNDYSQIGQGYGFGGALGNQPQPMPQYGQQFGQPAQPMQQQPSTGAWDGFKGYLEGSDYAFQAQRGTDAITSGYAAMGAGRSGAAMKGLAQFNQGLQAGYRNEYIDRVAGQQGVGLSAAGAQAGVGMNFANNASANNTANANAQSQAAIARANNSNALIGGLGNIADGVLGYMGGR